jgi:hypothetical protein
VKCHRRTARWAADGATVARGTFGSGAIDISRGSQLFFGPSLGVQFGY